MTKKKSLWELWETRSVFQGPVGHAICAWSTRADLRAPLPLEGDRREVVECRMSARRVVPAFDEIEDGGLSLGRCAERHPIEQLALERREEALAHRVVVAVAHRAHRRTDM